MCNTDCKGPMMVGLFIFSLIPLAGVFGTNLVLLGVAIWKNYSANSRINYKALIVILSLSGLFMLSWVPGFLMHWFIFIKPRFISQTFILFAINAISLNTFGNPFLYTLTNQRFGRYVRSLLFGLFKSGRINRQIAHRTGNREVNATARIRVRSNNTTMQSSSVWVKPAVTILAPLPLLLLPTPAYSILPYSLSPNSLLPIYFNLPDTNILHCHIHQVVNPKRWNAPK